MRWTPKKKPKWRRWFAWYPVQLENSELRIWWEYVERRIEYYPGGGYQWKYRLPQS